ncbi:hypothetical protein WMF18_42880 [Sorangium sp. So ce315]|uniref:hypothetical protein n=1 Tax=Sorangium sp. So ce315 TaxID=3133299 RepID=UPI003F604E26
MKALLTISLLAALAPFAAGCYAAPDSEPTQDIAEALALRGVGAGGPDRTMRWLLGNGYTCHWINGHPVCFKDGSPTYACETVWKCVVVLGKPSPSSEPPFDVPGDDVLDRDP